MELVQIRTYRAELKVIFPDAMGHASNPLPPFGKGEEELAEEESDVASVVMVNTLPLQSESSQRPHTPIDVLPAIPPYRPTQVLSAMRSQ